MDLKRLIGLRPKATDATSIREAIASAETAQADATRRAAALEADRARVLLDGSAADVERAERDLAVARADIERAGAMLAGLRVRLAEAEAAEATTRAHDACAEAEALAARFRAFVASEYPTLAAKIADGLRIEVEADAAISRAAAEVAKLPPEAQERLRVPQRPGAALHESFGFEGFGPTVRLPSTEGAPGWTSVAPIWG